MCSIAGVVVAPLQVWCVLHCMCGVCSIAGVVCASLQVWCGGCSIAGLVVGRGQWNEAES